MLTSAPGSITLANERGAEVELMARGAGIRALRVPDRYGTIDDVVLGYDSVDDYNDDRWYIGSVVGRYANRIGEGRFTLDGRTHHLPINNGIHHLHGGPRGFHTAVWDAIEQNSAEGRAVRFSRTSPDGEEGYPGTVDVHVTYTLTNDNGLLVDYSATTDQPTVINLTQHSYFNLGGSSCHDILGHELTIDADFVLPVDDGPIPTGVLEPVADGAFDFTQPRLIRERLIQPHTQIALCSGYDHCFVLRKRVGTATRAALLHHPQSGRTLAVLTTEPGVQLYTGQFLGPVIGKGGRRYGAYSGLCLETQHFPDSPNQPSFPSTVLRPGDDFHSRTIFRFGVRD